MLLPRISYTGIALENKITLMKVIGEILLLNNKKVRIALSKLDPAEEIINAALDGKFCLRVNDSDLTIDQVK